MIKNPFSLFLTDESEAIKTKKQELRNLSGMLPQLQNKINLWFSLEAYENHRNDAQIRIFIDDLFNKAHPYMDAAAEKIIDKIGSNYSTKLVEITMFPLLKEHKFNLILRDHNAIKKEGKSAHPDYLFHSEENILHYFECTSRSSSLMNCFFDRRQKFDSYLVVAKIFFERHNNQKSIYSDRNLPWFISIEAVSYGLEENERQKIACILGAYFGRDEHPFRFYSNSDSGFVRTAITDLVERYYQAHSYYLLGLFCL